MLGAGSEMEAEPMWKSFGAGIAVGVGIGWIAFAGSGVERSDDAATPSAPLDTAATVRAPRARATTAPVDAPAPSTPSVDSRIVRVALDAPPAQIRDSAAVAMQKDRSLAPLDYVTLDARVSEARKSGDWDSMRALLDLLTAARTPEARERLLALAEDDAFVFRDAPSGWYRTAFAGAGSSRLVAASRHRFEREAALRDAEFAMRSGWLFPVVDHGTETDLAWLIELSKTAPYGDWIVEWMADSPSRAAKACVEAEFRSGRGARLLPRFCERWGEEAFPVAWDVASKYFRGETVPHELDESGIFRAISAIAPKERVDEMRSVIVACADERRRVRGVEVAAGLVKRGFDRGTLGPLIDYPVDLLGRLPSVPPAQGDEGVATTAAYSIEYNRDVLWTPQAAEALEACARRFGEAGPHEHLTKVAMLIRKDLADPWRRK